jgi:osmoprotectant transport system permease protein
MELFREIVAYLADPSTYTGRYALQTLAWQHVGYSVGATLAAMTVAVPLGVWVGHRGRGDVVVVNVTNTGRAVPDFGIIVLGLVVLGYGLAPVYITLAALAIPPIVINSFTGVRQVDRDLREAAEGMGMTGWQVLRKVELPVAAPLIAAGIRTATVQVVATATLAGYLGAGGLGLLIFRGFAVGWTQGRDRILVACIVVALLALVAEYGLAALQRRVTPRGVRATAAAARTPA